MKYALTALFAFQLFLLSSCGVVPPHAAQDYARSHDAQAAFADLQSLVGSWERPGEGSSSFRMVFSLTAEETVLVEAWVREERTHSLTLYHIDGDNLLATHYCPQGNQPRLRLVSGGEDDAITFAFLDATNLDEATQSWQSSLSFDLDESEQSMIRREIYSSADGEEESSMKLVRVTGTESVLQTGNASGQV